MKLFLTGLPGVGKSTLLRHAAAGLSCQIGGFKTVPGPEERPGCDAIYLLPWDADPALPPLEAAVGRRDRSHGRFEGYPQVFDSRGTEILRIAAASSLVILDELGFMEAEARSFQAAVFELLDGPVPVIGVIKPKDVPFLNQVRAHRETEIWAVTKENRDHLREPLRRRLEDSLSSYRSGGNAARRKYRRGFL